MIGFLKAFLFRFLAKRRRIPQDEFPEEFQEIDFSKPNRCGFELGPGTVYDAWLRSRVMGIGLKRSPCLAWAGGERRYQDQVIKARLRLDPKGGYGAAGIIFRMIDQLTYYLVLVSSKGYLRLDVVRNNMPLALIGWTEFGGAEAGDATAGGAAAELTIIAYGSHLTLLINGARVGEMDDASIAAGSLGFALASYEAQPGTGRDDAVPQTGPQTHEAAPQYVAEAFLEYLSVDTRIAAVEAAWRAWDELPGGHAPSGEESAPPAVPAESRLRLAETFAAMGESAPALAQLKKLGACSSRGALLLAARLAQSLELYDEAEGYIDAALAEPAGEAAPSAPAEAQAAITEKAKILYAQKRCEELRDYAAGAVKGDDRNAVLWMLLGHARWELGEYEDAATAYDRAFALTEGGSEAGLLAADAANAYEALGRGAEALARYLTAGRAFLGADNYEDLGALLPKLLALGPDNWEARALAGKWSFGIEDWEGARREFEAAEKLRKKNDPPPEGDPAVDFLTALLLIREGKRREALPLLEKAAEAAPDYGLFRFRLAENRYLLGSDAADEKTRADLEKALALLDPAGSAGAAAAGTAAAGVGASWGWVNNLAAQIDLVRGDLDAAAGHLETAAAVLGEIPPVLVNRALYFCRRGSLEEALAVLAAGADDEGTLANCAGNLLVKAGQFDSADASYQKALAKAPGNPEFTLNRASCLIEMGSYGEADTLLARLHSRSPSPDLLEMIAYVAVKKGEYARAESACQAALDMDSGHAPALSSLGWIYSSTGRWGDAEGILARLKDLTLSGGDAERRDELGRRILEGTTRLIPCAACARSWRVPLDPPTAASLRIMAMPPDDLPAGSCPSCGKTYCIGCARENLDPQGRFVCPACGKSLKLINEGLKKLVADWVESALNVPDKGA
jgi:tetratricopeptide (TPR) repeat protein